MTQRERIEALLIDRGSSGVHSFEFYADRMPRGAMVICRLKQAGWDISAVPEPSPTGGQGVRYTLRSLPSGRSADSDSTQPRGEQQQVALELAPPSPPTSHWRFDT